MTSHPPHGGPDLFDLLSELDDGPVIVHALMPWMDSACGGACACGGCDSCPCGRDCRGQSRRHRFTTSLRAPDVTCVDCLAVGDLPAMARAAQQPARMARAAS